ncbi:MAG: UbiD family decarboxylase, partial [Candidatus Sumerlaeota bacterium]|nr:UbiD family decarboxylase [Candidatus Sumerlaeota bacterium]
LGGDPATIFSSICPLPPNVNEMILAGLIRHKAVAMTTCKTNDLQVPAEAEIVFEGYVNPHELRREGPFGDHTGFYSLADDYPVFHLTCVTHRRDAIYPATVVGRPPMEDCFMGEAVEQLFLPVIRRMLPEIVDVHIPFAGVFHNMLLVSIEKQFPGHARKVMNAIWGMNQAMTTKVIVVFDKETNLRDYGEAAWRALNNIDPERDIQFVMGAVDTLDHAARLPNYGSKAGVDATRKWPQEGFAREWPDEIRMTEEVKNRVDGMWKELGL